MARTFLFTITALLCFFLAGCSADIETAIVGEWQGVTPKQDLIFHEDGSIEMKGHRHGVYTGRYTIVEGNGLICEFPLLSKPVECTAHIRGDKLTLIHSGGRKEMYVRK